MGQTTTGINWGRRHLFSLLYRLQSMELRALSFLPNVKQLNTALKGPPGTRAEVQRARPQMMMIPRPSRHCHRRYGVLAPNAPPQPRQPQNKSSLRIAGIGLAATKMIWFPILWFVASTCNAQIQNQGLYGTIPAWAKMHANLHTERSYSLNLMNTNRISVTIHVVENPNDEGASFHLERTRQIVYFNLHQVKDKSPQPVLARDLDHRQNMPFRSSVTASGGWQLSVPNVRRRSVRILLRNEF
jgi:hypothetical protein